MACQAESPVDSDSADRLAPEGPEVRSIVSPDWVELKDAPVHDFSSPPTANAFGNTAPSVQQQAGALSGKIVFMNSGHGWTFDPTYWRLQRGVGNEMNEDYGNLDQLNFFAAYCFNAGATVVSMRPLGHQTNEIILDNDDAAVTWTGAWSDSTSTIFWGTAGDVPYRYASFNATESATATYTPTIPVAGFYPVYCWTRHGSDRGWQLYRIRHTGGEAQVRIPHQRVGNGWVYLGEYYFNAGANSAVGAVVISNLRDTADGSVVIADAIRFGNGMGSVDRGGGVSGYPREDESMRYWVQANLAQGQATALYEGSGNDESDSWSAPPKMSAEMNRQEAGDIYDRIHISFHSNAGGGRGTVGLITSDPTPSQAELANLAGGEVNDDLVALGAPPLEYAWFNKTTHTYTGGYSEIDGSLFNYEMPATIIEVAFHDDPTDAAIMRDARARSAVGKAAMHAVVKFMNQFDTNDPPVLAILPEAPTNLRAVAGTNGQIVLAWAAPVNLGGSQSPTNYLLYRSTNGYGFGNAVSVGNVTSFTVTNLPSGTDFYFRVTAANAGGESMPSEVVGCRSPTTNGVPRVLVVNGFDRFDRTTNLRHNLTAQIWDPPGNSGAIERVFPRWINGFDYVVQYGQAIANVGRAFDSCQNEAVVNNQVSLANYAVVIWACGNETVGSETFSSAEQTKVMAYLAGGGGLFVSGADVAYDLDRASGPTVADRSFLHNQLHAAFTNDNSTSYTGVPVGGGIFSGRASVTVDDGSKGIYWVQTPDVLGPYGAGAVVAMNYSGGTGGAAAIQYDGSAGGGRVVLFGFPFETITSSARRNEYLTDVLNFLSAAPATNVAPAILTQPVSQFIVQDANASLGVVASGTSPLSYQWRFNDQNLAGATSSSFSRANWQPVHSGNYDVVVSNAFGSVTSQVALVQVMLAPLQTLFADNFDVNTAPGWIVNSSSADTRVTFNYNYAGDGIVTAPNSTGGTTRGVKFEANMANGVAAAINISPVGQSFAGDYLLHFDLWINANGPFPLGGAGSTEHFTAGVATTGGQVQWNASGDGVWFAGDGEGQATDTSATLPDWRAFAATMLQSAASGVYVGGAESNIRGNGHPYYATAFPGGQTAPAFQQATYAQQTGGLAAGTVGFAWRDVVISKTGSTVEWFIDGLKIASVTGAALPGNNIFVGYWDSFASLSDNAALSFGLVDNLRVERFVTNVPPYITSQPLDVNTVPGNNVTFRVTSGGTATLAYQWRINGTNISGAAGASYSRNNVQAADAGNYSVTITNASGSVTSADALLTLTPMQSIEFTLIDQLPNGDVRLELSGAAGFNVQLLSSTNLVDWSVLTNLPNSTGTLNYTNSPVPGVSHQFYRAQYP